MTINELANEAGVTTRTIRYYVEQGVLPPPEAGYPAQYNEDHVHRLALIRRLKDEYLPLEEIRAMLDGLDTAQVQTLLAEHTPQMQRKVAPAPGALDSAADYINEVLNRGTMREQLRNKVAPNQSPVTNRQSSANQTRAGRRAYDMWEDEQASQATLAQTESLADDAKVALDLEMEEERNTTILPSIVPTPEMAGDVLSKEDAPAGSLAGAGPPPVVMPGGMAPPAPPAAPHPSTPAAGPPPAAPAAPAPAARRGWSLFPRREEAPPAPAAPAPAIAAEAATVAPDLARLREAAPAQAEEARMTPPALADQAGTQSIYRAAPDSPNMAPVSADETWRRIVITPGIELHILVRPEGRWNRIVTRIVESARHILADTPENEGETRE